MSEQNTNVEVPETIEFTDTDLNRCSTRDVLKRAWFQFMVTAVKKNVCKTGKYQIRLTCNPLDAEGKPTKAYSTLDLYPPIANPKMPGHEVAKPKNCYWFATSLDKNFPRYPKKVEGSKSKWTHGDETITDYSRYDALCREVNKAVGQLSAKWYSDPSMLLNETFYGENDLEKGLDGNIYAKVKWTRLSPPEDAPVLTSEFTMPASEVDFPEEN